MGESYASTQLMKLYPKVYTKLKSILLSNTMDLAMEIKP